MGDEGVPAGWYPDPMARHEYRYWDGARWTDEVADQGSATLDPLADTMARPVATPQTVAGPPPAWPVPVATAPRRGKKRAFIALGLALVAIGGLVVVVAVAANTSSSKQYPKFCATAAKLDAIPGDAASVVKNAGPIAQVLAEIEKLPPSDVPSGAGTTAQSLRTQLAGWLFGVNYDVNTFQPVPSAVQRWQSTARELSSNVKSSCKSGAAKFFAAGGPQTPTTTTPPRPVAGWASPGIRTLCVETNATFANAPLSREQVLGAVNLSGQSPGGLRLRKITLAAPGQPCDATLTDRVHGIRAVGQLCRRRHPLHRRDDERNADALGARAAEPGGPDESPRGHAQNDLREQWFSSEGPCRRVAPHRRRGRRRRRARQVVRPRMTL